MVFFANMRSNYLNNKRHLLGEITMILIGTTTLIPSRNSVIRTFLGISWNACINIHIIFSLSSLTMGLLHFFVRPGAALKQPFGVAALTLLTSIILLASSPVRHSVQYKIFLQIHTIFVCVLPLLCLLHTSFNPATILVLFFVLVRIFDTIFISNIVLQLMHVKTFRNFT